MKFIRDLADAAIEPCVATIGFFDGVHLGHRYLIEQVKAEAGKRGMHSALITFTCHPRKVMNNAYQPRLLSTPKEKAELLSATSVDYCVELDFTPEMAQLTARKFMYEILRKQLNVFALVIGYDHRFGHDRLEGFKDYCCHGKEIGIAVIQAKPFIIDGVTVSSTVIRNFLEEGNMEMANKCLGYEYYLDGTVVNGYKVGRTIGFPTANLRVEEPDKIVPADGVYAARVLIKGKEYMGMLDVGHRPTFNGNNKSIETNILDFSSDIYEYFIRLTFVKRLRSDIKFPNVEGLIEQLKKDEVEVRKVFSDIRV